MTTVEIEYCDPCGYLEQATDSQTQILESCSDALDGVELVPGGGGIFQVRVDDEVVFDTDESDYDEDAILGAVCDQLPDCQSGTDNCC